MAKNRKVRVCTIIEGAYPYVFGGVSIWLQQLISNLPEVEFVLWTIVPKKNQPSKFKFPKNVVDMHEVVLENKLKNHTKRYHVNKQWKTIHQFHDKMENGEICQFAEFYKQFSRNEPNALSLENIFKDFQGWELLTEKYNKNHPIMPFIDYYWSWRATHLPLLKMFQAEIPDADIYHAVSTGYAGLLGAIAKVNTGKPFILTEHGIYAKERELEINQSKNYAGYNNRMWKKMFHSLAQIAYVHADKIIALFKRNQELQIHLGAPQDRCEVIPNGIRIEQYKDIQPHKHKGFNVGFIGRMVAIKDVKSFIMAARIIKDQIKDAHFYLIGPQEEQTEYYKELLILVQNLDLKDSVTFTGKVDVKKFFPILDVLCLSSIKEAQPLALIESLMAGVPIVATKVGNVEDILLDDGIVVPPKSPENMADGVMKFAHNSKYRLECIKRGRERAILDYDLDRLIHRYEEIYEQYNVQEKAKWLA
ncbi:GT4 family glycosyltransferase PelF [candidate division KSB1 bacterium]|nr:GT4 family glycosyltransferase PelF [candidate division KSB1 bacterium]